MNPAVVRTSVEIEFPNEFSRLPLLSNHGLKV
jgi:hypothetical protein